MPTLQEIIEPATEPESWYSEVLEDVEVGPFDTKEQAETWAREHGIALAMEEMG